MTTAYSVDENRRQAVRVADRILFSINSLSSEQYAVIAESYKKGISLYNKEEADEFSLYLGAQAAIGKMREKDEDLAEFLQHMDTKINRILAAVSKEPSPIDKLQPREVDISGTGLAFNAGDKIAKDGMLELQIVLLPEYTHIYTVAKAVSCTRKADLPQGYNYRVACEYALIMDEDREVIIQHVFKRQQLALRNKRLQGKE